MVGQQLNLPPKLRVIPHSRFSKRLRYLFAWWGNVSPPIIKLGDSTELNRSDPNGSETERVNLLFAPTSNPREKELDRHAPTDRPLPFLSLALYSSSRAYFAYVSLSSSFSVTPRVFQASRTDLTINKQYHERIYDSITRSPRPRAAPFLPLSTRWFQCRTFRTENDSAAFSWQARREQHATLSTLLSCDISR